MAGLLYLLLAGYGIRAPKNPVPGAHLAGVVEAVGKCVTRFQPGDEVFGIGRGSFAECAREDKLAAKPSNLSLEQAAAVDVAVGAMRTVSRLPNACACSFDGGRRARGSARSVTSLSVLDDPQAFSGPTVASSKLSRRPWRELET
jgi:hypothetical protein